jgi:SAM-dependent methyltransferase
MTSPAPLSEGIDTDLSENPAELAEHGFRVAQSLCSGCRNYHALWGYERLARVKSNGFETERDILEPLLRRHARQGSHVLIAGAADAGLFAMMAQATRTAMPDITIADRCGTPLSVCRRYAEMHRLAVRTVTTDLTAAPLAATHDLAFAHNVLMLMPLGLHASFLSNIRRSLAPDGIFILVNRVRVRSANTSRLPPTHYATRILEALASRGVALPESEADFRRRLEQYAEEQHSWSDAIVGLEHVETSLAEAGLRIAERIDHFRRTTIPDRDGGQAIPMPTHIFVARRAE